MQDWHMSSLRVTEEKLDMHSVWDLWGLIRHAWDEEEGLSLT